MLDCNAFCLEGGFLTVVTLSNADSNKNKAQALQQGLETLMKGFEARSAEQNKKTCIFPISVMLFRYTLHYVQTDVY